MRGPATVLLVLVVAASGCAASPAPAPRRRALARTVAAVGLPIRPQPILVQRSVREQVTTGRRELEGIAMRGDDREARANALFELALLDIAFERMLARPDTSPEAVALRPEATRLLEAARAFERRHP